MNTEKLIVRQTDEERQTLETIVKKLKGTSQKSQAGHRPAQGGRQWPEWEQRNNP